MARTSEVTLLKPNFIKVFEPKLQQELVNLGFSYTLENDGNKQIYAFVETEELHKYLSEKYTDEEWHYIRSNRLCF